MDYEGTLTRKREKTGIENCFPKCLKISHIKSRMYSCDHFELCTRLEIERPVK